MSTYSQSGQESPGLWLGMSIFATLLCCLPLGVVGIVYSALALGAQSRGDYADLAHKVRLARLWTLWGIGLGLGVIVLGICASASG